MTLTEGFLRDLVVKSEKSLSFSLADARGSVNPMKSVSVLLSHDCGETVKTPFSAPPLVVPDKIQPPRIL
jgi:hypothetical protein